MPAYLIAIIKDYFRHRKIDMSVLGLVFWDIAYDVVLRQVLPLRYHAVCYADDILSSRED